MPFLAIHLVHLVYASVSSGVARDCIAWFTSLPVEMECETRVDHSRCETGAETFSPGISEMGWAGGWGLGLALGMLAIDHFAH